MNPLTVSYKAESEEMSNDKRTNAAAVIAHEVRNPLTNINLATDLLSLVIQDADKTVYLDIIRRSSLRINELLNELLQKQVEEETITEENSIHDLLDEVLEMAKDRILMKQIAVRKIYDSQDCRILLNRAKMKIALTNIIVNAIDAITNAHGQLDFRTYSLETKFMLKIEDNGCGISAENLKNIFKPYYTGKPGGMGLGLSATYDILRSNHVGVNVVSGEGEGTRFELLFDKCPTMDPFQ